MHLGLMKRVLLGVGVGVSIGCEERNPVGISPGRIPVVSLIKYNGAVIGL